MKDNTSNYDLFDMFFNPDVVKIFHSTPDSPSDFDKALADVWDTMIKETISEQTKTK